jgi:putative ABC exporter
MLSASLYITACTTRNRILARLRRLREPRYLVGAVVGAAYLYFSLFNGRRARSRRGDTRAPIEMVAAWQTIGSSLAGLVVFTIALLAWVLPARSGLLQFSRAETVFLFPAPVSRRQLLVHRLVRSQVGSLITSILMAIFLAPSAGLGRLRFALAMWALFVTIRVYFAAVELTRAQFASPRPSARLAAWLPVACLGAGTVVVLVAIVRQMMLQPVVSASDFWVRLSGAVSVGLPSVVLWPFMAVLRPQLATGTTSFAQAMAGSLAVMILVIAWMLLNDGAFELAAGEAAGQRTGETRSRTPAVRVRQIGPALALSGRVEWAILWKNAMQTLRAVNLPWPRLIPPAIGLVVGMTGAAVAMSAGENRGLAGFVAALGFVAAATSVVFGPMIMRLDLRSDFEHLELLKTWPVRASDLIRGEMAWPSAFVTVIAWVGLLATALFSGTAMPAIPVEDRWTFAASAFFVAPALIVAQYTVQNALALFFPAWVALGNQRTRGIDAMGQRLIMLAAILVALALFAVPGAIGGGIVWLALRGVMGDAVFIPAGVLFAVVVLTEVMVITELLGPVYERMDLTSVERAE